MSYNKIHTEKFNTLHQMLNVLDSRPNCKAMENEDSSESGSYDFTGTEDYETARNLLINGYTDVLEKVKDAVRRGVDSKDFAFTTKKAMPKNHVVGYIPNVPNAIRNIPQSMIDVPKVPQKRKTISIYYAEYGNCQKSTNYFLDAGTALLAAIKIIERAGIRVQLNTAFFVSEKRNEIVMPIVKLKDYGQELDLQKVCFPLAHPSMFRRFGFKYLETCPTLEISDFRYRYGTPPETKDFEKAVRKAYSLKDNDYVLTTAWIQDNGCDVKRILEKVKVIKGE